MTTQGQVGFPRVYAVAKWIIVTLLVVLAILATAFWTLVLGDFAGSGFHVRDQTGRGVQDVVVTPECAWPYRVDDREAKAVCRMFYDMSPQQQEEALRSRLRGGAR
jgi:hypothetical protein